MKTKLLILFCGFLIINGSALDRLNEDSSLLNSMMKISIDSALAKGGVSNNKEFHIDFRKIKSSRNISISSFLNSDRRFKEIDTDSLMKNDSTWLKYEYFKTPVIIPKIR